MKLGRYLARTRILELRSPDLRGALGELLATCEPCRRDPQERERLLDLLIEREKTMTTALGHGVALPHLRLPIGKPYILAVGRCRNGLEFEGMEEYRDLRLLVLLLASDGEKSYLSVLASLAGVLQDQAMVEFILRSPDQDSLRQATMEVLTGFSSRRKTDSSRFNRFILREAVKVAKGADCSAILIFADTFAGGVDLNARDLNGFTTIMVTQQPQELDGTNSFAREVIPVRSFSRHRLSQLRSAVLLGLTRGVLKYNDRLCCLGGIPHSNNFDTLVVVDVEQEFRTVFTRQRDLLPPSVKPEVMERVLGIATELAVEGREGKPVGCLFVLGETKALKPFITPLVLNPFHGYREEDRNILSPFMDETVKEFSLLDGAFVVRGDGVLESAGSLLHTPEHSVELPSGLGSRHSAAAAISMAADCLAVTVSASTGQVTLFRRGQMLPLIEKGVGRYL